MIIYKYQKILSFLTCESFTEKSIENILKILARWHFPLLCRKKCSRNWHMGRGTFFPFPLKIHLKSFLNFAPVLLLEVSERQTDKWQTSSSSLAWQSLQVLGWWGKKSIPRLKWPQECSIFCSVLVLPDRVLYSHWNRSTLLNISCLNKLHLWRMPRLQRLYETK